MVCGLVGSRLGSTLTNSPVAGLYFRAPISTRPVDAGDGSPSMVQLSSQVPEPLSTVPYGVIARLVTVDWLNAATAVVMVPWALPASQYSAAPVLPVAPVISATILPAKL